MVCFPTEIFDFLQKVCVASSKEMFIDFLKKLGDVVKNMFDFLERLLSSALTI